MKNLNRAEIEKLVCLWFKTLDDHGPVAALTARLIRKGLKMSFPDLMVTDYSQFNVWYKRFIHRFFNSTHTIKNLKIQLRGEVAEVIIAINWRAHTWQPPAASSSWLNFDSTVKLTVVKDPRTGELVISKYLVGKFRSQ